MNVLSCFDGMSCGQIALDRLGMKVDGYYASEIDKYSIKVAQANYPNTLQIGSIADWQDWRLPNIDLLIGGSPCQGFSFAGEQLNFDDPRSKLFFEFVDILNHLRKQNPNIYFLLENVKMKQEYQDIISSYLGVEPIEINSTLVSAQNRKRLYWTNITGIEQPEDKGLILEDIIEQDVSEKFSLSDKEKKYMSNGNAKWQQAGKCRFDRYTMTPDKKSFCITANIHRGVPYNCFINKKSHTLIPGMNYKDLRYRKLTPIECERLQTVPDNYTNHVSNTQRYKMLGNGWTVDVIAHIFAGLKLAQLLGDIK